MPGDNLLVAMANIRSDRRQLQPVERALAGQRLATITRIRPILACRIGLSHEHRQQRIGPELIVVVEILVPQRQSKHTLLEQGFDRVFDLLGIAVIVEAGCHFGHQTAARFDLSQKQRAQHRT